MKTTVLLILISMLSLTNCDKKNKQNKKETLPPFPMEGKDVKAIVRQVEKDCFILIHGDNPNIDLSLKENKNKILDPWKGIGIPENFSLNGFKVYITYDFSLTKESAHTCYSKSNIGLYGFLIRLIKIKKR